MRLLWVIFISSQTVSHKYLLSSNKLIQPVIGERWTCCGSAGSWKWALACLHVHVCRIILIYHYHRRCQSSEEEERDKRNIIRTIEAEKKELVNHKRDTCCMNPDPCFLSCRTDSSKLWIILRNIYKKSPYTKKCHVNRFSEHLLTKLKEEIVSRKRYF